MLRQLILGRALNDRDDDNDEMNEILLKITELIDDVYSATATTDEVNATHQAVGELRHIVELPTPSHPHTIIKRAFLLFSLYREREVSDFFSSQQGDDGYTKDLLTRVLPFCVPLFLRNSAQNPDEFCMLVTVFSELWRGERLGNWPLDEMDGMEESD